MFKENDGAYVHADAGSYQILINYRGAANSFNSISVSEVLAGKKLALLRDRIVLIGHNAESINDFLYTPYSNVNNTIPERTSGVEIQANIISQILASVLDNRPSIGYWHNSLDYIWIFLWALAGSMIVNFHYIVSINRKNLVYKMLSTQQEYWEVLFENCNNIIFVLDNNFSILKITSFIKNVLGFSEDEKINSKFINIIYLKDEETISLVFQ